MIWELAIEQIPACLFMNFEHCYNLKATWFYGCAIICNSMEFDPLFLNANLYGWLPICCLCFYVNSSAIVPLRLYASWNKTLKGYLLLIVISDKSPRYNAIKHGLVVLNPVMPYIIQFIFCLYLGWQCNLELSILSL